MSQVIFNNGVTFAGGGDILIAPELQYLFDETVVSAEYPGGLIEAMGYRTESVINPKGDFSVIYSSPELDEITEGQDLPELPVGKGPDKGYQVKLYGDKIAISKLMIDWLRSGSTLERADSSVKAEFRMFAERFRILRKAALKKKNFDATRVFTEGWSNNNLYNYGSPTPHGNPLFSDDHPYDPSLQGSPLTFRNILGGGYGTADAALSQTSLQHALDIHKAELRLYSGDRVATPSAYVLMTGRKLATTARKILQAPGTRPTTYSGKGNNAMQLNEFAFEGNRVALLEHPAIGAVAKGGDIGTDNYRFLINAEMANEARALRHIVLNSGELDMREDKNSKTHFVSFYEACAYDHYGFEAFVVGSRGTN